MKKRIILIIGIMILSFFCGCSKVNKSLLELWCDDYVDSVTSFEKSSITDGKVYYNGEYVNDYKTKFSPRKDIKYEFISQESLRFVNSPDSYAITFPTNSVTFDYSLSKYRVQAAYSDTILTISYEHSSPYGDSKAGWETYKNEWLIRYIDNEQYLIDNNLVYSSDVYKSDTLINEYEVTNYPIFICDSQNIEYPYYNISIIREKREYIDFYLFVSKSKTDITEEHIKLLSTFTSVDKSGVSENHLGSLEMIRNPLWSDETNKYFDYLNDEKTFDFGFFRWSLPDDTDAAYRDDYLQRAINANDQIYNKMGYKVEVQPTYTHLGWYSEDSFFPSICAETIAGGNGFNNKPVLQFTFQFTRNNNNVSIYNKDSNYTPMFDILRGNYDEYFRTLASQIKAYSKPVLFRLNNEMNTDWTSYSGIISLLDPDIFRLSWIRMYEVFEEVGVDNCIWIFNPVAKSCPYSSWGEDMCYMPGVEYVQALGITHYEMLNTDTYISFTDSYSGDIYTKNKTVWKNYPWVISEFGCGSGGNTDGSTLYRNADKQALWVSDMLDKFANKEKYEFVKKISVAVWFNSNDSYSNGLIENALNIDNIPGTINAFKEGFKKLNEQN